MDDHHTIHLEIGALLRTFEDVELVAQGGNGKEAVLLCDQHQPDIVLMDISMPVMNGIEATRLILERHPQIRVIAMTGLDDAGTVQRMIAAGAAGYLLKEAPPAELASIIHAVYGGNAVFSADVMKPLLAPRHQRQTRCAMITA